MSDDQKKEIDTAFQEYVKAEEDFRRLHDRYIRVGARTTGMPITFPKETLTQTALKELEEAEGRVAETLRKLIEAYRN